MYGSASEAPKDARAWCRLLRGDDAFFVLHFQPSVRSLKYIHHCSGVAWPVRGLAAVAGCASGI